MNNLQYDLLPVNNRVDYVLNKDENRIVKKGAVVSIKHKSVFEPVLSVIQKVEKNIIYTRFPDLFLKSNVLKGDCVSCNIMQDDFEYVLYGTIIDIDIKYPWLVGITIDDIKKFKNKRKSKRYMVNFQAQVFVGDTDESIYGIIKNLSMTGANIVFKEKIEIDSFINLLVRSSIKNDLYLEFKGKVVRLIDKSEYTEHGLEISNIDHYNKENLTEIIQQLEKNEKSFIANCLK
ncbi:PilZ domain-containing protein [Herbivorax sp. ANBcel31]|uniref:PilZ domain-containing protein n=1 Tax=Herbivorax sp. ANBcel31 TaxID=3069754 RepID=UPI0027AE3071|nr:PilZ domain-containing protein [Herbivorax sp. ANBcel31]MDQ2086150.1 PilZ domain-containing protein [Herbivorax sp. ANBcel31]